MSGGVGVEIGAVVGLLGEWGLEDEMGCFSCMLEIGHNVKYRTNYVKSLLTSHNSAILENLCEITNYFSRPSAILEKVREIPIRIFHN